MLHHRARSLRVPIVLLAGAVVAVAGVTSARAAAPTPSATSWSDASADDAAAAAQLGATTAASGTDVATAADTLATTLPDGPTSPAAAPATMDTYPRYQGQTTCDPTPKPGTVYLLALAMSYWKIGRNDGISRDCSVGGISEHKEGRAFDWGLRVDRPAEKAAADAFTAWLTATGPDGKPGYIARRLGVMYVIWNTQIWSDTNAAAGWQPYVGTSEHTDHVHVSLTWAGAYERTSWWTGVALPTVAQAQRYTTAVYRTLFGRTPDQSGLTSWTSALVDAGQPLSAVANGITASTEYRSRLVSASYSTYLGRAADADGLTFWLARLGAGATTTDVEAGFLASDERWQQSGQDPRTWITTLYADVLGRQPSDAEVAWWQAYLLAHPDRAQVARGFLLSTEHLGTVVDGFYVQVLRRHVDDSGRATWVAAVQGGMRAEQLVAALVTSTEYATPALAGA